MLFGINTHAHDYQRAKANLGYEYAECSGYYTYGAIAAKENGKEDLANQSQKNADQALKMALALQSAEIVQANVELAEKSQGEILKKEGFSRLILKYADNCKTALEDPDARIKYWQDKE